MSDRDDVVYLRHILESITRIEMYLRDADEQRFMQDLLLQDGVIRQLGIIGEAVKRLSPDLRMMHDAVPWKDIAGMRDKLVHDYFGVDLEAVWEAATKDLPILKTQIEHILDTLEAE